MDRGNYLFRFWDIFFREHPGGFLRSIRDKKLLQKIALVIKDLRAEAELNQIEVYNDTNIHVGRIETAKSNLSVSTLAALCKYFKISLSDFHKKVENW